jgi:hypothetical protein
MDEAPSRAELRDQSRKRQSAKNRRLLLGIGGGVLVVAIIAVVVAVVARSGGDTGTSSAEQAATVPVAKMNVSLRLGNVSADSAGPPAQLAPEQKQAIMKVVGDYLEGATVDPLRSAKPAGDLSALFDAGALARVTGVDRGVMLDEGLPRVTGDLDIAAQPVGIVALADQSGTIVLATATIDLDIKGVTVMKGVKPLRILRKGDLVLAPDPSGAWKVTAFNIAVARTGAGLDPTTTTAPTSTSRKGSK